MIRVVALTVVLGIHFPVMPVMPLLSKTPLFKPLPTLQLTLPASAILLSVPLPKLQAATAPKEVEPAKPVKKVKTTKARSASQQEEDEDEDWEEWIDELFDGRDPREGNRAKHFLPEDKLIRDIGVPLD